MDGIFDAIGESNDHFLLQTFFLYFRLLEKIIRPLLDVQIADMNRGFEKTEISSVVDILAQDVHELPTRCSR